MSQLVRGVSAHIRRAMTGVGRTTLVSEIDSNRSIVVMASILNPSVPFHLIVARLNDKLLSFDRFKSKITTDSQYFEIIPDFDCMECMVEERISASTLSEYDSMNEFVEQTLSSFSNRPFAQKHHKPLWRVHIFQLESLKKTIMVFRCHHCICDGVTFGQIWHQLSDNFEEESSSSDSTLAQSDSSTTSLKSTSSANSDQKPLYFTNVLSYLLFILLYIMGIMYCLWKMFLLSIIKEPRTIFTNKLSQHKYVSFINNGIALDVINKQRKSLRVCKRRPTFNDYMLAVIAESIQLYLQQNEQYIPDSIHLAIPVNVRNKTSKLVLGNKIGSYVVQLPVSKDMDFMDRLKKIKKELDFIKRTPEAKCVYYAMLLFAKLPKQMADIMGQTLSGGVSLVASNMRGSEVALFMCGAQITDIIGLVPPPLGVGLGYVLTTFAGKVIISVNVDKNCYDEHTAKDLMDCLKSVLKKQGCFNE